MGLTPLSDVRDVHTNLIGNVTFPAGRDSTNIYVQPLADGLLDGDETVTLTLLATNGCVVDTNSPSATIVIQELATNIFMPVVTGLGSPIGIDYHAPSNSLIVP